MYHINLVDEANFYELVTLHKELHDLITPKASNSTKVAGLIEDLKKPDAFVLGLYKDDKMVGFLSGFRQDSETILFNDLYIQEGHRLQSKKLCDKAEEYIKQKGYIAWETSSIEAVVTFAPNLGAKRIRTIYRKEL